MFKSIVNYMDVENEIKFLGIDWGLSKIGLSLGSNLSRTAVPWRVVKTLPEILNAITEEEVQEVVLGQPLKMSGEAQNLTEEFLKFSRDLQASVSVPVHLIDERLTSKMADTLAGHSKAAAEQDAIAAMLILQSYLDRY